MLRNLFIWILNNVFHIKTETTNNDLNNNEQYAKDYQDISKINFNAIFSNKLGKYVANDSTIEIMGDNPRTELLNKTAQSMWKKMAKIVSMAFGYGGVLLIPYVKAGKIFYDIVPQTRLTIDETAGDLITGATVLSEKKVINSTVSKTTYLRWTNYRIENNNLIIEQKYTNEFGSVIDTPDFWKDIQQIRSISNVDRVPFGYIKSSINNRRGNDRYGVPITYGCDETIQEIRECLMQIRNEYELKRTFVLVDKTSLDKDGKFPSSGIFKSGNIDKDDFWQIFDPAIRDSSYYNRLQSLFAQLEKEIGTSRGILTDPLSTYQNTDETKRALYDTLYIINAMRENVETGLEDFFYSCDILANAFNLTPIGTYELKFDWDFGLIQSQQEQWQMLTVAYEKGIIKDEELRQFIYPSEDLEATKKAIEEIKESNPSIQDLLGTNNAIGNNSFTNNNQQQDDQEKNEDEDEENEEDKDKNKR